MSYDPNLWNQVINELRNDRTRQNEMNSKSIACQKNQSLRWYEKVVGSAGYNGYALFICLHGGGQGSQQMNDSQWKDIIPFESGGFQNGTIAVACRGITNTWNLHFVDESFPAITRLIEDYIIFRGVDPNRVYLMGFSAGGDGTYSLSQRIPHLLAACSPQGGHPNGVSTINICNCPIYLAAGEKDSAFKRNQVCVEYYNKIMGQNGKYLGNYNAKVEVVGGSGHSFQCWKTPRKSYFNGSKSLSQTNETAFTFMYSHTRNPNPTDISLDVKTFLTKLRNYYTQRGNTFYNIEVGKNTSDIIQVQINYNNNVITIKEGTNFKINLISSLFRRGNVVSVVAGGKTTQYRLQQDANYAKNNMKLFCDPNYGFDSYVTVGNFQPEVNVGYLPQPPQPAAQTSQVSQQSHYQQIPQQNYYQQQIPPGYGFQQQQGYGQVYPGSQIGVYPQQAYPGYGGFPQQQFGGYGRRGQQYGFNRQYYY
jgi:predicted esterase